MNMINRSAAWLGRVLQGAAVASLAAGIVAFAPSAHAQSGTLNNPSNCTSFTGFTWNGATLTLSCSGQPVVQPTCTSTANGAFSWAQPNGSTQSGTTYAFPLQTGTSTTVYARRSGGCAGAYTLSYAISPVNLTGQSPSAAGTITFADGDTTDKPLAISAGSTAGTLWIYFSAVSSSTGSPTPSVGGTLEVDVSAAPVLPPAPSGDWTTAANVPQATCSTQATYYAWWTGNAQQFEYGTTSPGSLAPLKPGETVATAFIYRGTQPTFNVSEVTNPQYFGGNGIDVEIAVSQCPNDFPAVSADTQCDHRQGYKGGSDIYGTPAGSNAYWCQLTSGNKYYLNVRQVLKAYPGAVNSCNVSNGCAIRFQAQGIF